MKQPFRADIDFHQYRRFISYDEIVSLIKEEVNLELALNISTQSLVRASNIKFVFILYYYVVEATSIKGKFRKSTNIESLKV